MRCLVNLSADAYVTASVEVEAASEEEAKAKAIAVAKQGDAVWKYGEAFDETVEAGDVVTEVR